MNTETKTEQPLGKYRPSLAFYHATGKGDGCAVKFCLHPAHDNKDGCIMMTAANQVSVGSRTGKVPTFSQFDWEAGICVKLDFNDLSKILQVLRGECEDIEEGRGLYHKSIKGVTRIYFKHVCTEGANGYSIDLLRTPNGGTETDTAKTHILLKSSEALGLCEAIAGAMVYVGLGIPMLVPHNTAAYDAAKRTALAA